MVKDYEIEALAMDLKSFAAHMIGVQVAGEFWDQLDEWREHIMQLVDAQEFATKAHVDLINQELTKIAQKEAEDRAESFGLAMLALSLVTGPLISYVAGRIEHVIYPRLAPVVKERSIRIRGTSKKGLWQQKVIREDHFNEVHAKVFGDLTGQVIGLGINGITKLATPDLGPTKTARAMVPMSDTMASFKRRLGDAFVAQAKVTRGAILSLAGSIANNPNWGFECLEKLYKQYQGHANPERSEKATLQNLAYGMIRQDIDRVRRQWANDWFFYGNNPPVIFEADLREAMEIEQWSLWILNDGLGMDWVKQRIAGKAGYFETKVRKYQSKTFGDRLIPDAIVRRLADFEILEARSFTQSWEKTKRKVERNTKREAEPKPRSEAERKLRDDRWKKEDAELLKQRPSISIGDSLDSKQEYEALQVWAKDHPPQLSEGNLMFTKRHIQPIDDIVRSGKYRL